MSGNRHIGFQSALLVSWGVISGAFIGALLAWWIGIDSVGILLMAVALTGLVSRLWGLASLREMEVSVQPDRESLSVGQSVVIHYTLKNNKVLPLVWVELLQDIPVRDCLIPDKSFQIREFSEDEAVHTGRARAYIHRFSFVMSYSVLEWETRWTGNRRGIYRPENIVLRAGDGFGLTQSSGEVSGLKGRMIVVWPQLVPVDTDPFLRYVWTGTTGNSGWSEDPTVMRGERAYQPGDSWKRIDWRAAARTDELMIRQYETVTPLSVLFILDAAALADPERGISVTASLIHALFQSGISCGLALPASDGQPPLLLRPEDPGAGESACLYALSAFDAEHAGSRFDDSALVSVSSGTGQIWIVSEDGSSLSCRSLAEKLSDSAVRLLAAKQNCGQHFSKSYTFDEVCRKEAAK